MNNQNKTNGDLLATSQQQDTMIINIKSKNYDIDIPNANHSNNILQQQQHYPNPLLQQQQKNDEAFIQINYLVEEPLTHRKNKKISEKLFSCWKKYDLKQDEILVFSHLRSQCNIKFDSDNQQHNDYLKKLWLILKNESLEEINNEGWKIFGFQNKNPRTDFRGGGLMSLKNLLYFCSQNPQIVADMCLEEHDFLLGVSSINITFFMMKFFHLADFLEYEKDQSELCDRKTLKRFCQLLKDDYDDLFNKLHSLFFTKLFEDWKEYKRSHPNATILNFGGVQRTLYKEIREKLEDNEYHSFQNIAYLFQKSKTNQFIQ